MGAGSANRERLQSLALALGAFALAYGLSAARIGHGAPDFYVFWTAARHLGAPYDPSAISQLEAALGLHGVWPFVYPPTLLLVVCPFSLIALPLAYPLWTGLSAALFVHAGSQLVRPAWAAAALVAAPPVFIAGELGQTTLLVGAAAIGGFRLIERRPLLAGVLFGVAACIKPQAMVLAPLVLWGRWRVLAAAAATGLALVLVSCLAFGPERWFEWRQALGAFAALAPRTDRINPSALFAGLPWALAMAALGLWLAFVSRDLVGLAAGALLVTPYAHAYDLAPLAPLALAWVMDWRRVGWSLALAGAALLAGLLATPLAALAFCLPLIAVRTLAWVRGRQASAAAGDAPGLAPAGAA